MLLFLIKKSRSRKMGATKKLIMKIEDMKVAVTFAEAREYDIAREILNFEREVIETSSEDSAQATIRAS